MHMLPRVRSDGSYPCGGRGAKRGKGCSVVGRVRHAEADSRNPLTGVVSQHTTVSAWVKSAGSASVCGMSALCLNRMDKDGGGIYLFIEEMQHQQRTVRMCFSVSDELCLKLLPTHSCFFVIPFFLLLIVSFWKSIRQVFCYVRRSFSMPIVIFLLWNKYTSCLDSTKRARIIFKSHYNGAQPPAAIFILNSPRFCLQRPPTNRYCHAKYFDPCGKWDTKESHRITLLTCGLRRTQTYSERGKIVLDCGSAKDPSELTFTPVEDFIKAVPDGCWCQAWISAPLINRLLY